MQLIKSIQSSLQSMLGLKALPAIQSRTVIQSYNQIYPSWNSYREIAAFKVLDDIYSVVTRLAKNSAAIPLYGYDQDAEDLPETDRLTKFLKTITYIKKLELYTWLYLRGECFIYKKKTLGVNGFVESIHFLNPSFVTLVLSDEWPTTVVQYRYLRPELAIDEVFEKDEVIFIKNFNPSDNYLESWRGLSAVQVLCKRLQRMESNMANSVAQMQNGGVPGVLYMKDVPHAKDMKTKGVVDATRDNFTRFMGNHENKGAPFFAAGDMGYFMIGSELVDLQSIEIENVDFKKVCNAWGVSDRLFNNDATGSEISDDNAQLGLYTNAIIPTITMVEDAFNTELVNDFGVGVRIVKHDLASVYILQQIQHKKALVWRDLPVIVPNRVLEDMGESKSDDPLMDLAYIKIGYEPIDNLQPLPPIEG